MYTFRRKSLMKLLSLTLWPYLQKSSQASPPVLQWQQQDTDVRSFRGDPGF